MNKNKVYYEKHKTQILEKNKKYYQSHKSEWKKYRSTWAINNKEKIKELQRIYRNTPEGRKIILEAQKRFRDSHKQLCHDKTKAWRIKNKDKVIASINRYENKYPERVKAKNLLASAIRYGKKKKGCCCEKCGSTEKIEGHHNDYSKPLDVMWLCNSCHVGLRRK